MCMVKAVLFDLFETLITESQSPPSGASSLAPELGLAADTFRTEWRAHRLAIVLGRVSFLDALADIGGTLRRDVDRSELQRVRDNRIRVKAAAFDRLEPRVLGMIGNLRSRGVRLGVVSNCFAEDVTTWSNCHLAPQFDCTVFSFQVGLAKPDPAIYLVACRRLGVAPAETVFVGDGMHDELKGAEDAGLRAFQALWFLRRWPQFRAEQVWLPNLADVEDVLALVQ